MPQPPQSARHSVAQVDTLRDEFQATHSTRLPALLDAALIQVVLEGMGRGTWMSNEHVGLAREVILDDMRTLDLLHFVANTPAFLALVRELTGCHAITRFEGRVYRMVPGTDHHDSWHDDAGEHRLVGMSLNLGPRPYAGGTFQIREKSERAVLRELPNTRPGDAILFRISDALTHRVTRVEGPEPKTAFAGWFLADGLNHFSMLLDAARARHG
jgi:hypothetical protein